MKTTSWFKWLGIGIAIAVPTFTGIMAVAWALPLPIYDYWDVLQAVQNLSAQSWNRWATFLWEPFVDQKMVGPKLLIWGLSHFTNNRHLLLEIFLGFAMQLGALVICTRLARQTAGLPGRKFVLWRAFTASLLFWPLLLWRFQHHWYSTQYSLVILPALGAICLVSHRKPGGAQIGLAALLALFAGLSHGTGLFLWPILGIALMLQRRNRGIGLMWLIASILLIAFFTSEQPPRDTLGFLPLSASLKSPGIMVVFALRCLGLSLGHHALPLGVIVTGAAGTATYILVKQKLSKFYQPWLIIWCWTLLVASGSALSRSSISSFPSFYYSAFFILGWIAAGVLVVGAGARYIRRFTPLLWGSRAILVLGLLVWIRGAVTGVEYAGKIKQQISQANQHMKSWPVVERACLAPLFPQDRFERSTLRVLARRRAFDLDPRPLVPLDGVGWKKQKSNEKIILIPTRALESSEMLALPEYHPDFQTLEFILHSDGIQIPRRMRHYQESGWLAWREYPNLSVEWIEIRGIEFDFEPEPRVYGRKN